VRCHLLSLEERPDERAVLRLVEREVQVVVAVPLPVARAGVGDRPVDRLGGDDGREGVVEVEPPAG
jgi:hypothetical protein